MGQLKKRIRSYPVLFCVIYLILLNGLRVIVNRSLARIVSSSMGVMIGISVEYLVWLGITLMVIQKLGLMTSIRLQKKNMKEALIWAIPGGIYLLIMGWIYLRASFWSNPGLLFVSILNSICNGLMIEIIARGLMMNLMIQRWKGQRGYLIRAIVISSFLFVIARLLYPSQADAVTLSIQLFYAFLLGIFLGCIIVRGDNIWPAIFIQSAIDFIGGGAIVLMTESSSVLSAINAPWIESTAPILKVLLDNTILLVYPLVIYGVCILYWRKKRVGA
ncbi:predicted metal-dependent membrane protease, CAAX amino terminal protease family [Lachnospiraceae bacterium KM106-2]|nr:predicted metal-dependent membrane protease, CAAX amino terminal protease family [Lachnospiraceae bacterium KM106-2]